MKPFFVVWSGQLVSIIGTSLTWFGLSVWVYLETGSVTQLSMMMLAANAPRILLSPIAGVVVDRVDRRVVMIAADSLAGLGTVVIAIAFFTDSISFPLLVTVAAVIAVFEAFHWPAYQAATTLLVPKDRFSQASGMIQMSEAAGQLLAPVLGASMVAVGGVGGLIAVDVITFLFAVAMLALVRFPNVPQTAQGIASRGSVLQESAFGFRYIWRKRPLLYLLAVFAGINLMLGGIGPILIAYLLSFSSEAAMGTVFSVGATGMLVGSIVASARKVNTGRVARILGATMILGAMMVFIASSRNVFLIVGSLWLGMFVVPYASAMSQSLWMAKVEPDVQGKVFAARAMIAQATNPVALLFIGAIADGIFVPLMGGESILSDFLAIFTGREEGSGYAALFVVLGLTTVAMGVIGWLVPTLRHLERDVPDAEGIPDDPSEDVAPANDDIPSVHAHLDDGDEFAFDPTS